jgi:transposase
VHSRLFPASVDDYVAEDNAVRAVELFVEGLDLGKLGFWKVQPPETGRPRYDPKTLLKVYIYGYLNRVPSSRRLERECQRNLELIRPTGSLAPDFKTIADFRMDNGEAIREVCREFVALCRRLQLLTSASVAIHGSKFKAVNARDKNFTEAKMQPPRIFSRCPPQHRASSREGKSADQNRPANTRADGESLSIPAPLALLPPPCCYY